MKPADRRRKRVSPEDERPLYAYVGGRTPKGEPPRLQAINVYRVDRRTGRWRHVQSVGNLVNPSFFALDREQRCLYAVHGYFAEVSAFAIDAQSGRLAFLNQQPVEGRNPVALTLDAANRFLVVANYSSGAIVSLSILPDRSLGAVCDAAALPGEPGPHRTQQASSHPHHVITDPAGHRFLVPDKGLDCVHVYRLAEGKLVPNDPPSVRARPGAAPRHIAFHPFKPCAYVINELDSTITTYRYFSKRGVLVPAQIMPTLPPSYTGRNTTAEIVAAPSGKFVYGSNRGHDSIAIFAVKAGGTLAPVGWEPTRGKGPRFFTLDPSGNFLYAANETSGSIVAFRVDRATGKLRATGQVTRTDSPVCILFAAPR